MDFHGAQVIYPMSQLPRDGSADGGLSGSLLRFIDEGQLDPLRQALSGFNHRCRNMLNSMKIGFYLTKRAASGPMPDRWDELNRTYTEVERLFDLIQGIYRTMSLTMVRRPFRAVVDELRPSWRETFERRGLTLLVEPPVREAVGEFDAMQLASALDGFIAWRASVLGSGGGAVLSWSTVGGRFQVRWTETAGATQPAEHATTPTPPYSALAATTRSLSLPLLARVIAEHRGRLAWTPGSEASAYFWWPLTVTEPLGASGTGFVPAAHLDVRLSPRTPADRHLTVPPC